MGQIGGQYPHLFKRAKGTSEEQILSEEDQPESPIAEYLPSLSVKGERRARKKNNAASIDAAIAQKVGRETLIRMKVMDYTLDFLEGRPISNTNKINELYDIFYNKIKNGTKQQKERRLHQ